MYELEIDQKQMSVLELRQLVWKDARGPNPHDKKNPLRKGYVERREEAFEEAEREMTREYQALTAEQRTSPWSRGETETKAITARVDQETPEHLKSQPKTVTTVVRVEKKPKSNEHQELKTIKEEPVKIGHAKTSKSVTIKCDRDQNETETDPRREMEYQYVPPTYRVSYNPLNEEERNEVNWKFDEIWSQSTRFLERTALVKMNCQFDKNAPLIEFALANTTRDEPKKMTGVVLHYEPFSPTKILIVLGIEKRGPEKQYGTGQDFCVLIKKNFITENIDIGWYLKVILTPTEIDDDSPYPLQLLREKQKAKYAYENARITHFKAKRSKEFKPFRN